MRIGSFLSFLFGGLFGHARACRRQSHRKALISQEVFDLVTGAWGGMTEPELNRARFRGCIQFWRPKVAVGTNAWPATFYFRTIGLKTGLFDGDIAYVRVGRVADGLSPGLREDYDAMQTTNKLKGVERITLCRWGRFTGGGGWSRICFEKGAAVADLGQWGGSSTEKKRSIERGPRCGLWFNPQKTTAAAEALAAMFVRRELGDSGWPEGGSRARRWWLKNFRTRTGDKLRIATREF